MKKFILVTLLISLLVGCAEEVNPNKVSREMLYAPTGAKFIRDYGEMWTKWSLDGECFLTYNMKGASGLMSKVDCNPEL